ncbi:MAG: hypothetical protein AAB658_15180 [Chloroflexota bacterium]
MKQQTILFGGETSALQKSQVESLPVKADKKLSSTVQVVGDFSIIPTTAIELLHLVGSPQLNGIKVPTCTKSARKGWRLTAKW